ncbi:hypothetical protein C8R47DRAFT_1209076 [Mycena vitilis]|nr:hypothetical protein C8R47DRAFT_1209076 [Mycena vitilis]
MLNVYCGDAFVRFLSLFVRAGVKVDDVERASTGVDSDLDTDTESAEGHVESTATEPEKDGRELLSAAVAADLCSLPSLPSLLKSPPARPPRTASNSLPEKQEFGQLSNVFYEHRLPFGNVTNLPRFGAEQKGIKLDNLQVKASAPRVKSKSRAKKARPVQIPVIIVVDTDALNSAKSLQSDPACGIVKVCDPSRALLCTRQARARQHPQARPRAVLAPAPGCVQWEREKAAALAQA